MAEGLTKLRPDRDVQCYFRRPSAVAVLSETSATGFTVSGCWREQLDWAVVEWNRDNIFEHPAFRNLPDGDLSGVHLCYEETRENCIPFDSTLYPTVEWPYLRIWAEVDGTDALFLVPLKNYASAVHGGYIPATAHFELQGNPTTGDYVELAWLDQHFNYLVGGGSETLEHMAGALAATIAASHKTSGVTATASGNRIALTYLGMPGANGNRVGVYGTVHGTGSESWVPGVALFTGGISPDRWRVELAFGSLQGYRYPDIVNLVPVPTNKVRKMRWTWAADLQPGAFQRSEFAARLTNWTVSGAGLAYKVAGPGSRRIEDDAGEVAYSGTWREERGNYSGGTIRWSTTPGAAVNCVYRVQTAHTLYLGTRREALAAKISARVDGRDLDPMELQLPGEDALVRIALGEMAGGVEHSVSVTHAGAVGEKFHFDFFEIAVPASELPGFDVALSTSLATDWDTDHSLAIAPERTAWLIHSLGCHGRVNHYAGALWFYELYRPGHQYASATVTFSGTPEFGNRTRLSLGATVLEHLNLIGDTAATIAKCFELIINAGTTGVWAQAAANILTITSRTMGSAGNGLAIGADTNGTAFAAQVSGALAGGGDSDVSAARLSWLGDGAHWRTDTQATPRINRAARDWSRSFFQALGGYGMTVTAAFSMELQHGDDRADAAIAQRYPDGGAAWLNTPALQTNFGPEATAFWREVHQEMAGLMVSAGMEPYLQFGEVQWWYFPAASGMPFYDQYTTAAFFAAHNRVLPVIASRDADPAGLETECAFLAGLIGQFTQAIAVYVKQTYPQTRFEVLYPPDVNDTPLNRAVNFPTAYWTPATLACLKTENFTYTGDRNLDRARLSMEMPLSLGFSAGQTSHLIGIGDCTTPWRREQRVAMAKGMESVVLFAVDQLCLIGYGMPGGKRTGRARFMGS